MNWTMDQLVDALKKNPALRVKQSELDKLQGKEQEKKHKYNAKPGYLDGIYFRSQEEMNRYCELKILKAAGTIIDFELQPKFDIGAGMKYTADFKVMYPGYFEIEEVKGRWTTDAKMRIKLFKEKYPNIVLKIITNGEVTIWGEKQIS